MNVLWCFFLFWFSSSCWWWERKMKSLSQKMKTFSFLKLLYSNNRTEQNNRLYFWIWKTEKSDPKSIKIGKNSDFCLQTKLTNHYHCFRSVFVSVSSPHPNEYRMKQTKKRIIFRNIAGWRWWTNGKPFCHQKSVFFNFFLRHQQRRKNR